MNFRNKKVQTEILRIFRLKCEVSSVPEAVIPPRQGLMEHKHSDHKLCVEFSANSFLSLPQSSETSTRSSFSSSSTSVTTTRLTLPCHEHI